MAKKAPLLLPLVAVAGILFFYTRKAKAAEKEEGPEVGPLGSLPIIWEDGGWTLAGGFEDALNAKLAEMYPDGPTLPYDPLAISWAVLGDEVPVDLGYPSAPRSPDGSDWQADVPGAPNYFEGEESVLGLLFQVADQVSF